MNPNFFSNIKIENFKSLRSVELNDCNRINLFIGKPNVGKSNILEALSFIRAIDGGSIHLDRLEHLVRYSNIVDLVFDGENENIFKFQSNLIKFDCKFNHGDGVDFKQLMDKEDISRLNRIKKYVFQLKNNKLRLHSRGYSLFSPHGENLLDALLENSKLLNSCQELFSDYRLQLFYDSNEKSLKIAKRIDRKDKILPIIYSVDYGMIADTLQRIIFYKAAIASNKDSILLFEEPEAHAFPPYITHITQEMIQSKTNQFFVTTHSPFVFVDLLENAKEELAVFIVDWKDGETIVKRLTDDDLHEIYQYGIDIFLNLETFLKP
jgi:AAA15 family ATPase/GTPase